MIKAYIVMVLSLSTIIVSLWFALMIKASTVPPPRAVSWAQNQVCADMPRGSQVLENNRQACFNELYDAERIRLWE